MAVLVLCIEKLSHLENQGSPVAKIKEVPLLGGTLENVGPGGKEVLLPGLITLLLL